jgi:hypothetical protein
LRFEPETKELLVAALTMQADEGEAVGQDGELQVYGFTKGSVDG